jgi:hypothetical protein
MSYLTYHLLRDPKFWFKVIVLPGVIVLAIVDVLSAMLNPPGLSNFKIFFTIIGLTVAGVVAYGVYLYVAPKKELKIRREQGLFEKRRLIELESILRENKDFKTFCFQCRHFNHQIRACGLVIKNHKARTVRLRGSTTYCLYWEKPAESSSTAETPEG